MFASNTYYFSTFLAPSFPKFFILNDVLGPILSVPSTRAHVNFWFRIKILTKSLHLPFGHNEIIIYQEIVWAEYTRCLIKRERNFSHVNF